jgi:hypothetical protein
VYQRRGEPFTDQCVYESDRYGGGSVMVWDGIFHVGRTQLIIVQGTLNVVKYRDDIFDIRRKNRIHKKVKKTNTIVQWENFGKFIINVINLY